MLYAYLTLFRLNLSTVSAQNSSGITRPDDGGNETDSIKEIAAAYARYSSESQDESSIEQQFDSIEQAAARNHHFIPVELRFMDEAVSGRKLRRIGLNAILEAARKGLFKVMYIWNISRLARESAISIPMIKDLVYNLGIRIICTANGFDTNNAGWESIIYLDCILAEAKIKQLTEDVKRGHQNNVKSGNSNGDHCYGYASVVAPGSVNQSRARKMRPKKVIDIDPAQAEWVVRIFRWYCDEGRSVYWITTQLNRLNAPRGHRASGSNGWTTIVVIHILENVKYVGLWPYGKRKNKCNPLTGDVTIELRSEGDEGYSVTERPNLRIVEVELFYRAQQLREQDRQKFAIVREKNGRLRGSVRDLQNPRHMLQGLFKCEKCGRPLYMNGLRGLYLQCSGYPSRQCDVKTSLLRKYAEEQIVGYLHGILLKHVKLREWLFQAVTNAWNTQQQLHPQEREGLERRRSDIVRRINAILECIEQGEAGPEVSGRLSARRRELNEIQRQLDALGNDQNIKQAPTREWVIERLLKMHHLLEGDPARAGVAIRQLIGCITVREVDFPGLKRKKLVGTFTLDPVRLARSVLGLKDLPPIASESVTLCFAPLPIWAQRADEVKALYDQNLSALAIAEKLGLKFAAIAKGLMWWYVQRGLPVPTGSEKRSRIIRPTPIQDAVISQVIQLWNEGKPIQTIAEMVGCSRNSVTVMIKKWHQEHGLPWLHGKTRQKQLRLEREKQADQDAA